jgi:multidrug resistance efflux pump
LRIEQANHEQKLKGFELSIRGAERDVAELQIKRRKILAPMDGIVVERYVHVGEWLRPGDPVLRLIRMDRLYVKGMIQDDTIPPSQVEQAEVEVTVVLPMVGEQTFSGKVVFASPEVMTGSTFQVWAEVINRKEVIGGVETGHYLLRPGLNGTMKIKLKRWPTSRMTTEAGDRSAGRLVRLPAGP